MSALQLSNYGGIPQWISVLAEMQDPRYDGRRPKIFPLITQAIQAPQDWRALEGRLKRQEMMLTLMIKQLSLLEEICSWSIQYVRRRESNRLDEALQLRRDKTALAMMKWREEQEKLARLRESVPEKNYFRFVIPEYHTARQGGQRVSVYVKYAYTPGLTESQYPDYRELRKKILTYMEPSLELPEDRYWEIIAKRMGRDLKESFRLDAVSIELYVLDNTDVRTYEPGDHGPTFTIGDITPVDVWHRSPNAIN